MRPRLLPAVAALAVHLAVPAYADPTPDLTGYGWCSMYAAGATHTCSYITVTPFGELSLYELDGADGTITARCSFGSATLTEPGYLTFTHAGKCAVILTSTGPGHSGGWLRSVLGPGL